MRRHLILFVLALFWLATMTWLWRSEFGGQGAAGSAVPVQFVWEKILTAPDYSALQITHRGTNIGYCRWSTGAGQDLSAAWRVGDESGPVATSAPPAGYDLDLEGNITLAVFGTRLGYDLNLKLGPDQAWQEFHAKFKLRPDEYRVDAVAADKSVRVASQVGGTRYLRTFSFADLQNPQRLLREAGGPLLPALLASAGVPLSTNALARLSPGLTWQARQDWLLAGRTRMRVYRLETKLLDRFRIRVSVSPVGEILRVELPGEILFQHETLNNFPPAS
jgi:hypothetical protein